MKSGDLVLPSTVDDPKSYSFEVGVTSHVLCYYTKLMSMAINRINEIRRELGDTRDLKIQGNPCFLRIMGPDEAIDLLVQKGLLKSSEDPTSHMTDIESVGRS
jgi:hypothetical protein